MSTPHGQPIALSRLALVHRTSDGTEHDRATGPELAALLFAIPPAERAPVRRQRHRD